ncbi:MAG: c-type cytochrome [Gammaproteobacteria bacterium]|nr:c-type cytochrome [Rhodocyclaceae bacterium]MBU3909145.1 c-type cytochrome [Gammaproteobacteria bacterium]MBU3988346.1 c-type cytochrome [Gammaproteobacteria bacterium]MBU4005695.1 c-type cytochrome [Gammaproteobacteria bacterium]MBU4020752.1 c-type cytochrome [Gammaproteobacteria bacterium]
MKRTTFRAGFAPLRLLGVAASALLLGTATTNGAELPGQQDSGKEINGPCAACHGDQGQGGKRGEYPRLAGQRAAYLEDSLKKFRTRERLNLPMLPYTQERELSDTDIKLVSAYLAGITLQTTFPDFKDTDDALTRLEAMEKVMIIPKLEGDLDNGKTIYEKECADCHGKTGKGTWRYPMLVGQYTNYLQRQMDAYLRGERAHDMDADEADEVEKLKAKPIEVGVLGRLTKKDIDDILAYITRLQD